MARVPLIFPVDLILYRLNRAGTWAVNPPGSDFSDGMDPALREPVIYKSGSTRVMPRAELAPDTVPCQLKIISEYRLRMLFTGDDPVTNIAFILHRKDLSRLGLIDSTTGNALIEAGDRIAKLQKRGRDVRVYEKPLYVYQVRTGSQGFGPDGYDLEWVYTSHRAVNTSGM